MAKGYARYVLGLMVAINLLNYMDRWVAASAGPSIEKDLGISDPQFGLLGTAFLLVYAVAALPFGYWGDRGIRKNVITVGVGIWSVATLFTGFARTFGQLFLSRAVVGIGEASYYPAGTSLLSDYFPKEQRSRVAGIWNAGSTVGIAIGFAAGGFIAEKYGWQKAFFVAAIPGLLLAAAAFALREPLRGAAERVGPAVTKTAEASFKNFALLFFVLASNAFWLPTLLQRRFAMTPSKAGLLAGVVIVVGGLIGTLAGGWIADHRGKTNPKAHLQVGIAGFLAGSVLVSAAILSPLTIGPIPVFVPVFLLAVIALYLYQGPFTALSQNVVSPALRASAVTTLLFVAHVFGDSHSTYDVGQISDWLGGNLQAALLITSTVQADIERMEQAWATNQPGVGA